MELEVKVYQGLTELLSPLINRENNFHYPSLVYQLSYKRTNCFFTAQGIDELRSNYDRLYSSNNELALSLRDEYFSVEDKKRFDENLVEFQKLLIRQISSLENDLEIHFYKDDNGKLVCINDSDEKLHYDVDEEYWKNHDIKLEVIPTTIYEMIQALDREIPKKYEMLESVKKYRETINTVSNFLYPVKEIKVIEVAEEELEVEPAPPPTDKVKLTWNGNNRALYDIFAQLKLMPLDKSDKTHISDSWETIAQFIHQSFEGMAAPKTIERELEKQYQNEGIERVKRGRIEIERT